MTLILPFYFSFFRSSIATESRMCEGSMKNTIVRYCDKRKYLFSDEIFTSVFGFSYLCCIQDGDDDAHYTLVSKSPDDMKVKFKL